jgi:hypothetical protein
MKALCALLIALAIPVAAHHAWPVNEKTLVTVKGTVVAFDWANPHPMITLEVAGAKGTEKWQVGGPALNRMEANGWTKSTVKTGDVITGIGYQYTDGQKIIKLDRVVLPTGKEIKAYGK